MSESSSNIVRSNLQNKVKDIQGGEKKVMKKSLSVVLSTAMALSMFSSVAFGKTSADFTDLKDLDAATKAKFDALISAGIFDGVSETTFGLKDEMNRAQFAKVAALITGIEVNKDLKTSSFSDVKVDDAANGYALPFIEALKTAGITDGYGEGTYNPAGKVTKEQLATFLVRVLGKDADAKAKTGTDTTVSDWAQGYVALALELKLLPAGADGKFGGQDNATRDLLLTGAYEAKQQYVPAGKVSVTEAKATGVKKVTVTFNKPVDTAKAKLALKKGSVDVVTETAFNEDKKSAVLTLKDVKIGDGDYTVTLSGLEAETVGTTTATFKGEVEAVKKLDFVSAADTIAQTTKAQVKLAAKNQYDEVVDMSASNFTAVVSGFDSSLVKDNEGYLVVKINTKRMTGATSDTSPGLTMIPVYVYNNDTRLSVQKTFKLGSIPFVSKIELSEAKYSGDKKTAITTTGETATFTLNQFDQYGNPVAYDDANNSATNVNVIVSPYEEKIDWEYGDFDNNGFGEVKLSLKGNVDKSGEYNVTVYSGSSSATAKFKIGSTKLATKIEFGDLTEDFATLDEDKYIPLIAYDADGNKLSKDDIASTENVARIKVTGSNVSAVSIATSGQHKGEIKIDKFTGPADSIAYLNAYIATVNVNSNISKQIKIGKPRFADSLKLVDENKLRAVLGADSEFKIEVRDQYGKKIDTVGTITEGSNTVTYSVYVGFTADTNSHVTLTGKATETTAVLGTLANGQNYTFTSANFGLFNKGLKFQTDDGFYGKGTVKVVLQKSIDGGTTWKEVTTMSRDITAINPANVDLTYALDKPTTLFAAQDSKLLTDAQKDVTTSVVARTIKITAKDSAGNSVAIPEDRITSVTSSVYSAAVAKELSTSGGNGKVIGNKKGTATINVIYNDAKGGIKTDSFSVEVKDETPSIETITADEKYDSTTNKTFAWEYMNLKLKDQYGVEYKEGNINAYDTLTQVRYTIEDVVGGTVTSFDTKTGAINVGTATGFTLKAYTANGKVVTTYVKNQ
ncbi:S-layer homology domain-containing protein [Paenibacillus sedimenti]|uniref:S-layer homology domain-containing protein n=1 Tax=Paenibacillus sedimenti TaxID=2770274 RepID=A0A926KW07_9BACL|nr:S-layer homology domain-containing protein [Paenibacillus sedimenti]MBD0384196.1 S-layer homology domain-containing protein [Paenibacillus sedimenti]